MSVTFYAQVGDVMTQVTCGCGAVVDPTLFASYADAYKAVFVDFSIATPKCGDDFCGAYTASFVAVDEMPEVNVSNINAVSVLDVLGISVGEEFEDRCAGVMSGEDFLSRVLVASAVQLVDAGVPTIQEGNMIRCGRSEGYLNEVVARLQDVAEYAVKHNVQVSWN